MPAGSFNNASGDWETLAQVLAVFQHVLMLKKILGTEIYRRPLGIVETSLGRTPAHACSNVGAIAFENF